MDVINIERAILATFLYSNDLGDNLENVYKLDLRAFSTEFNKRVAEMINNEKNGNYGFLSYTLEEKVEGTKYEQDWIEILAQSSLGLKLSKRYHDTLLKKNILKGIR